MNAIVETAIADRASLRLFVIFGRNIRQRNACENAGIKEITSNTKVAVITYIGRIFRPFEFSILTDTITGQCGNDVPWLLIIYFVVGTHQRKFETHHLEQDKNFDLLNILRFARIFLSFKRIFNKMAIILLSFR
ncbi:hypothetical protein PPL_05576 [Heterostelium album PN500]|uniref:Uncharacterized protein n=1 Tax=Heterostelium pallidum (strain ATCC 26659 / Pp 5 / PN500) TaxID=670386 RepID=D3BAJ8_HETP5|nr:hypothetical protein PPL_05576 [Heterostelium album PN500]EFA81585.1 hypothetical protein PPL_05576 [Heterostelium album PN500]|eukprot:XP_020433702.1 hypothetical protein PPL_05576 [Heterostelium album PN500]